MKRDWLLLTSFERLDDLALLLLRGVTGAFLISQTIDNVTSQARMVEFEKFLTQFGFVAPELMAPLSVWVQFLGGAALILGLLTRWAGLLIAFNFTIAVWMVHWPEDFRGWWPALILVFLGLLFATHGPGRYALDHWIGSKDDRDRPQTPAAR
jgi:putative oxidoreductase